MRSVRKCNVLLSKGRLVPTCLETDGCEPCRSANRFEPMIFEAACRQSDSVCFIRLASSLAIDSCNRFLVLRLTPSSRVVRCFCFVPIAQLNQMAFLLLVEFSTTPSADRVLIDSQLNELAFVKLVGNSTNVGTDRVVGVFQRAACPIVVLRLTSTRAICNNRVGGGRCR
jgi:hypothetical protein